MCEVHNVTMATVQTCSLKPVERAQLHINYKTCYPMFVMFTKEEKFGDNDKDAADSALLSVRGNEPQVGIKCFFWYIESLLCVITYLQWTSTRWAEKDLLCWIWRSRQTDELCSTYSKSTFTPKYGSFCPMIWHTNHMEADLNLTVVQWSLG